jgi:hypothetical protein
LRTIQPPAPKLGVIISYAKSFISNLSSYCLNERISPDHM